MCFECFELVIFCENKLNIELADEFNGDYSVKLLAEKVLLGRNVVGD